MPLYEYQCDACGHRFEQIRKFSDPPLEACPKCGAAVRKLVSSPAFHLKGSGWYVSDYQRKGEAQSKDADGKTSEKSEKSKESGESKESDKSKDSKDATGSKDSTSSKESTAKPDSSSTSAPASSSDTKTKPA